MATELLTTSPPGPATSGGGDLAGVPPEPALEVIDGFLVDAAGEIVGLASDATGAEPDRFEVRDADGCDWVLARISDAEAEAYKVEAQLRALRANLETKARWYRQIAAWFRFRFGAQIEAQARRDMLPGKKTAIYPHGQVAIRTSQGSVEITDSEAAAGFLKDWLDVGQLKLVVRVSDVQAAIRVATEINAEVPDVSAFAKFHGPAERAVIKTGIGKDAD